MASEHYYHPKKNRYSVTTWMEIEADTDEDAARIAGRMTAPNKDFASEFTPEGRALGTVLQCKLLVLDKRRPAAEANRDGEIPFKAKMSDAS